MRPIAQVRPGPCSMMAVVHHHASGRGAAAAVTVAQPAS
jgi:hypothetical protein